MIAYKTVRPGIVEARLAIPYQDAHEVFLRINKHYPFYFLLESKQVSLFSGRFSLIGIGPSLKVVGKGNYFEITALNNRAEYFLGGIKGPISAFADTIKCSNKKFSGIVEKFQDSLEEGQRSRMKNIAQVIRIILDSFKTKQKTLLGLYGAFSYDFIRLFENLGDLLPVNKTNDFTLFLYDTFLFFDHIKQISEIVVYRRTEKDCLAPIHDLEEQLMCPSFGLPQYKITKPKFSLSPVQFRDMVKCAREYIKQGEIVQVVFSNILKADFSGDPFALYLKYREKNPSPYLFYFELGDEQLVGASPEMMVRCEEGLVHLRPIAGTAKRGSDPFEDHDNLIGLLVNPKERAELDMLVDLGRSDLSRICEPGIIVNDYRFVEKYARVMHTVTHLTGKLKEGCTGLDALISCLNAGTLTGAPKVAAMKIIEKHEKERRSYYGGTIGQLTFSGDVDTGIVIRTAHIKKGKLRYQSGAGIVYDSDPGGEYQETLNKSQAFLDTFS